MRNERKFKVGDRVIYRAVNTGNTDLDGWVGTVIGIDNTEAPYTVRFDDSTTDMGTDERFYKVGQPRGHDWFCKEENLSPIGVRRQIVKKNEKGKENNVKRKHEWTEREDKLIREMLEQGESVVNICDRIGVDYGDMKNHLYALRKADPTFPRCQRTGRPGVINEEFDRAFEEEPKGALNDLEAAMAEQIKELTEENDRLAARNAELGKNYEAKFTTQNGYIHKLEARVHELEAVEAAMAERISELEEQATKYIEEFETGVRYFRSERDEANKETEAVRRQLESTEEAKRVLETKLAQVNAVVVELVGRFVV